MGFAASYNDVQKFECSAAVNQGLKIPDIPENQFILYSADKVDHNTRTLMMQAIHCGSHPGKSSTVLLPMIDMDSSNMSCIYSTLKFICSQARKLQVTPVLTFDQPLWFKATMIVENEPDNSDIKQLVLRLGGLHVQMSFLGSIGHVMAGSGGSTYS